MNLTPSRVRETKTYRNHCVALGSKFLTVILTKREVNYSREHPTKVNEYLFSMMLRNLYILVFSIGNYNIHFQRSLSIILDQKILFHHRCEKTIF